MFKNRKIFFFLLIAAFFVFPVLTNAVICPAGSTPNTSPDPNMAGTCISSTGAVFSPDPFASDPSLEAAITGTGPDGTRITVEGPTGNTVTVIGPDGTPITGTLAPGTTITATGPDGATATIIGPDGTPITGTVTNAPENDPNVFDLNQLAPQNGSTDRILNNALNYSAGIAIIIAVFFIIYGGYQIMMAGDDPGKFESGVKTIKYTIIGLLVIFLSAAIVNFVAERILEVNIN